ncbi:BON domain-containing protein [Coralloluteibacterium stylophorae]
MADADDRSAGDGALADREGRDSTQPITDTWITTKVKSALLADDDVAGLDIDVETANGVVVLTGDIDDQNQLAEARRIAQGIEGVTRVETNRLQMNPARDRTRATTMRDGVDADMERDGADRRDSAQPVTDTWITTKVKSALLADDDVAGLQIDVDTANGVVTLEGDVESQNQIAEARRVAQGIEGVTRVETAGLRVDADARAVATGGAAAAARTDRDVDMSRDRDMDRTTARADDDMDVAGADASAQPVTDTWITTKVKSALLASGDVSGLDISVETNDGVVMLTGAAETEAQVRRATALARAIEGVTRVDASGLEAGTRKTAAANADRDADAESLSLGASDQPVDDTWITTKVKSSLLADDVVSGLALSVQTINGVVSLQGDVESQAQIDRATRIVETIDGVRDVNAEGLRLESGQAQR